MSVHAHRIVLTACVAVFCLPAGARAESFSGQVVGVSDGDTIKVMRAGKAVKVRLSGIDCPERRQAFGRRAKRFTSDLVFRKTVTVEIEDIDRWGRLVAEVLLPDGKNLNHELVRAGLAWWYRRYAPKDDQLKRLEQEARAAKRGLWADPDPLPPWEYRKQRRGKSR